MYKRILGCALLTFFCQSAFAETCPNIDAIKTHLPKGWKIYDSEEDIPLIGERLTQFKKEVNAFVLAEWVQEGKNNKIHCYYRNKDGSNMETYIVKDNSKPNNIQHAWYKVSGALQCAASSAKCEFQSAAEQFAKK